MSFKLARAGLLALAVGATAMGCAEERDPINRVQANALSKSFFVGQDLQSDFDNPSFYANGTLLDIGYGAAQDGLFTAFYSNDLSLIRWEITEDYLIGRLAFERIEGSDGKGAGAVVNDGQIIYAFAIEQHFDVRRAYNPSTGEELNVIEENTADRPWNSREYFRVDWSRNMVTDAYDFDTSAIYGLLFGVEYQELGYYISDPKHEHAPRFEPSEGYFDITTKAMAQPGMVDLSHLGWGIDSYPACFLGGDIAGGTAPAANCNPHEITIRHSFWRAPDRDYEPQDWDGYRFQAAGAFTKERYGFSRDYGMVDTEWHRFISRYNIWDRSHYYDEPASMTGQVRCFLPPEEADAARGEVGTPPGLSPTRDDDRNGTHDECEAVGRGSRCDEFKQRCTLPFRDRETRPIVWYYTNDSNMDYYDSTIWSTQEWDVAMKLAVNTASHAECLRTGGDQASCDDQHPVPHGQMTMMMDAINVEREVDACRKANGNWDVAACEGVVDRELSERGYDPASIDYRGLKALAMTDDLVVLCHSPIQADDHPLCAPGKSRLPTGITAEMCQSDEDRLSNPALGEACESAYTIRIGDVRHHLINVIESPETPSPWGFGPTYADPLTGEAISASINVWSQPTDRISRSVVDVSRFIAGELTAEDIQTGEHVKDWAQAAAVSSRGGGMLPKMTRAERDHKLHEGFQAISRSLDTGEIAGNSVLPSELSPQQRQLIRKSLDKARSVRADAHQHSQYHGTYVNRMKRAAGSDTEAALTTGPIKQLVNASGSKSALPATTLSTLASPLRGHINPTFQRDMRHMRELALADRGACMLDAGEFAPSPTAMIGLTRVMQEKFGAFNPDDDLATQQARADRMKAYLAQKMHYAVMIHEMGHTFGFRHNFVSSSNAFFYRPQYWQLRTRDGQVGGALDAGREGAYLPLITCTDDSQCSTGICDTQAQRCADPAVFDPSVRCSDLANSDEQAADCIGPRYFDPVTQNESDNLIHMWMHSSTMEYGGDVTQNTLGLGAYDFHATRMMYGDVATVFTSPDFTAEGGPSVVRKAQALNNTLMDSFGGILGYSYSNGLVGTNAQGEPTVQLEDIHYSELNGVYDLIQNCAPFDPTTAQPSDWDVEKYGEWHPIMDGHVVSVDGEFTRCFQQPVSYVNWDTLRQFGSSEATAGSQPFGRTGPSVDQFDRLRVPYGFATDRWADLGNVAVYRHDNGADPYELFEFFITEQELRHIFDNYRREQTGFSVRRASSRVLGRYNEKMRDAAKGMAFIKNIYREIGLQQFGLNPESYFNAIAASSPAFRDTMLSAGFAFDHFARQMQRPQAGLHVNRIKAGDSPSRPIVLPPFFLESVGEVLQSGPVGIDEDDVEPLLVPDGPQGFWNSVGIGGKPVNNGLSDDKGEYDSEFTLNAGSYYDKIYSTMLFTESVDNFIASDPEDFVDARFRSVSLADLFPDGFRRWLSTNLTNDEGMKGAHIAANSNGRLDMTTDFYPAQPLGWTTWWTNEPEVCFAGTGTQVCTGYDFDGTTLEPNTPAFTRPLQSQVGWEQQKFLIAWTLVYLPENAKQKWLDMMGIWNIGVDNDPGFSNRIELHVPTGDILVARTYGTEEICFEECKTVQRGIGARILEYANELMQAAYVVTPVTQNGVTWYEPVLDTQGQPFIRYDENLFAINPDFSIPGPRPGCQPDPDPNDADYSAFENCECNDNAACEALADYMSVPEFMRSAMRDFGVAAPSMKGIY